MKNFNITLAKVQKSLVFTRVTAAKYKRPLVPLAKILFTKTVELLGFVLSPSMIMIHDQLF